jgi:hypothetical protein
MSSSSSRRVGVQQHQHQRGLRKALTQQQQQQVREVLLL